MKKTAVLIAALILSAFCSVPVFATGNDLPEEQTIGVFAKAVYTLPDGCYGAEEDDGDYIVPLPDGTEITVTPEEIDPSLRLVVDPITEQDPQAYQWFLGCTAKFGTNPMYFDIYFINEYGLRVDVNMTATVSIALPKGYGTPKVAAISPGGTVIQLATKFSDNTIFFTIKEGGYYTIVSAPAVNTGMGNHNNSPQTGDSNSLWLWIILLDTSMTGIAVTIICGRKKKAI